MGLGGSAKLKLGQGVNYMRTYRLARFVAVLLFLAALIYFCGGVVVGLSLWNRGLGAGWGSGFTGWISIPIFIASFFGALTLLMIGAVLYFLSSINANLTQAREGGVFAAPRPKTAPPVAESPIVPPAPRPAPVEPIVIAPPVTAATSHIPTPPLVEIEPPAVEAIAPPDLIAELPDADADADGAAREFTGRLPGAEQAARIASELAAAKGTDQPDA